MNIAEAIVAHLVADLNVTALVGTRIYPKLLPQSPAYPAVVLHLISGGTDHTHDGPDGIAEVRYQIDCLAPTIAAATAAAEAVRVALDGYQGTMGGAGGVLVDSVFLVDSRDDYDDEMRVFVQGRDYAMMIHP